MLESNSKLAYCSSTLPSSDKYGIVCYAKAKKNLSQCNHL
jgi:hypothetical protein